MYACDTRLEENWGTNNAEYCEYDESMTSMASKTGKALLSAPQRLIKTIATPTGECAIREEDVIMETRHRHHWPTVAHQRQANLPPGKDVRQSAQETLRQLRQR